MSNYGPRMPLFVQNPELAKALRNQVNPSYESFKPHQDHKVQYRDMEDRPGTHHMSVIRRNPDGTLDFKWAKNMVIDAIHKAQMGTVSLTPFESALLTILMPDVFRLVEPKMAEIMTQLSKTEKTIIQAMVLSHLKEEENWNAGQGGGSVESRHQTRDGIP